MKKKLLISLSLVLGLACISGCSKKEEEVTLTLAAAASLENVFEDDIIPAFEKEHPNIHIQGVYDSSGKLQKQIENGLDADIFFSAATKQMTELKDEGYINEDSIKDYLINELVLITGVNTTTTVTSFENIQNASTIAIGDPEVVPAGQYAKTALTKLGVYDELTSKYSLGGNVTEVLSWVVASSSEVGIVYETDAKSTDQVQILATCNHQWLDKPVVYPVAKIKKDTEKSGTGTFFEFIQSPSSKETFEKYGFTINS